MKNWLKSQNSKDEQNQIRKSKQYKMNSIPSGDATLNNFENIGNRYRIPNF